MADEPIPVIPTLHNNSVPVIKDVSRQMAYIVRWYFANPGRTSSNNEEELISFRKLNAIYGKDPLTMCNQTQTALQRICSKFVQNVNVEVTYEMKNGRDRDGVLQGNYTMTIRILDATGMPLIEDANIAITENGEKINVIPTIKEIRRNG